MVTTQPDTEIRHLQEKQQELERRLRVIEMRIGILYRPQITLPKEGLEVDSKDG